MHFKRKAHGIRRAPHPAPPARPRGRRRRLLVRLLGWVLVLGLLLGVAGSLYLIYVPWSSPLVDRRAQQVWLEATGIPLTYDKATYLLRQGAVEIESPTLLDPAGGAPLLAVNRIRIDLPFQQFLTSRAQVTIHAISVDSSLTIPLLLKDQHVIPAPPLDRLATLILEKIEAHRQEAARRKVEVRLGTVQIGNVSVQLSRGQGGLAQSLVQINEARLNADFGGGSQPRLLRLDGLFNRSGSAHDLHLSVRPDVANHTADCRLDLDRFDSMKDLPWRLPFEFNAAALSLAARLEQLAPDRWSVRGATTLSDVNVRGADALADQPLGQAEARYALALDLAARRLDLTSASLASKICTARAGGSLGLAAPFPYTLGIQSLDAQGPMFALIADILGRSPEVLRPGEASIRAYASLSGNLRQKAPKSANGRIELAGLNLHAPGMPPLDNLALRAEMTTETLVIENAQAIVQGMPLAFSGRIRGHALRGEIRSADINWKADGDLVSISTILKGGPAGKSIPPRLHLSGKVAGEGRFQVREPLAGTLVSVLERSRLEGEIDLKDVTIDHPGLMEPIRKLSGRVDIIENTARLKNASGQWMGVGVTLNGSVKGKPLFWNKPHLTLTGAADFDLAKTRGLLTEASPPMRQRLASVPAMDGLADLDFSLDTELEQPQAADYQVTLNLKDFATDIKTPWFGGPLRLSELRLALTPARFRIARATGRWGALAVATEGELAPAGGSLNLTTRGDIHELERLIPIFDRLFNVAGGADLNGLFEVRPREGFTPPKTWQGWWTALQDEPRPIDWRRWAGARWRVDGGGVINARNVEYTYAAMPARLTGISGPVRFDMRHLWTPNPLPVSGGERSRGGRGSIDLVYGTTLNDLLQGRPFTCADFTFHVTGGHVATEEWLQPWHFHHQPARPGASPEQLRPYDPAVPSKFKLHGDITAPSAAYKGVPIRNFHCALALDVTPKGYENQFLYRDITGQIGAGDFRIDGRLSGDLLCDVKARMIDLGPFIKGLTGKDHVSGLFSGRLSGWLQLQQGRGNFADLPLDGRGEIEIVESRFVSNKIFNSLGGILKLPIFQDISFSTIAGPFSMRDSRFSTPGMVFKHPLMHLNAVGAYGPDKALNMQLQIQLLAKGLERVPLVGQVLDEFNKWIGKLVRVNVRGTIDAPQISVL